LKETYSLEVYNGSGATFNIFGENLAKRVESCVIAPFNFHVIALESREEG